MPKPVPEAAAAKIRRHCARVPALALVLGSGFQHALNSVAFNVRLPFERLPGFPKPTVAGHGGELLIGDIEGTGVLVLSGRSHFYEGLELDVVTFPIRVLAALRITELLLTNAAGGIHPRFKPGDFMMIRDHINAIGANPLRGWPGGDRFVDLTEAYDPDLRRALHRAAATAQVKMHSGVYMAVAGPSYETPAEIRAFRRLGADAVGMSTVPEVIVARQCGIRVAAVSCITNLAAGLGSRVSHDEVLQTGERVRGDAARLIRAFVKTRAGSGVSGKIP